MGAAARPGNIRVARLPCEKLPCTRGPTARLTRLSMHSQRGPQGLALLEHTSRSGMTRRRQASRAQNRPAGVAKGAGVEAACLALAHMPCSSHKLPSAQTWTLCTLNTTQVAGRSYMTSQPAMMRIHGCRSQA